MFGRSVELINMAAEEDAAEVLEVYYAGGGILET